MKGDAHVFIVSKLIRTILSVNSRSGNRKGRPCEKNGAGENDDDKVLDSFTGKAMERVQCKQTVTGTKSS